MTVGDLPVCPFCDGFDTACIIESFYDNKTIEDRQPEDSTLLPSITEKAP